jgi:hypothetical protein
VQILLPGIVFYVLQFLATLESVHSLNSYSGYTF